MSCLLQLRRPNDGPTDRPTVQPRGPSRPHIETRNSSLGCESAGVKVAIVCRSSVEMAKEMSTKNKWRDAGTGERNGRTKGEREMSGAVGNAQKHRHQNATLLPAAYSSAPRLSVRSACPIRVNQPASLTRNIESGNICIPAHSTIA